MRTLLAALLLAAAPGAASAGPSLGLRLGYDASSGDAAKGTPMSEVANAAVPIQLDALWHFGSSFSLGAYYSFGFGILSTSAADACSAAGASCSAWGMRAGVEAQWAFTEVAKWWAPWIGAGIGYEWAYDEVSLGGQSTREGVSGWELLNVEGGADAKINAHLWLGPYVSLRYARYTSLDGYGIANTTFHSWLGVGVRASWEF